MNQTLRIIIFWMPILGLLVTITDSIRMFCDILFRKNIFVVRKYVYMKYSFIVICINLIIHMVAIFILMNKIYWIW